MQYVIDKPMGEEPGKVFNYRSGATELLAYIFQQKTGHDIDAYGESTYSHCWASSSAGSAPTSESSIPRAASIWNGEDLGYLYLHDGLWNGKQIVSKEWVKDSRNAYVAAGDSFQYGFKWWLYLLECKFVWMARGFGGQRLMVFPQEDLIAVFTGCEILNAPAPTKELVDRLLPAVKQTACTGQQEI